MKMAGAPGEAMGFRSPGEKTHNCIRRRFASGAMHRWIFEKRGKSLEVMVKGSLSSSAMVISQSVLRWMTLA
jgi:hypothetical protein